MKYEEVIISFSYWFCPNYKNYNEQEATCIVDQYSFFSLIAARLL